MQSSNLSLLMIFRNSGIEMTWARIRNTQQGIVYEASQSPVREHKEYTYNIPTKGMISSDGKLRRVTPQAKDQMEAKLKQENKDIQ